MQIEINGIDIYYEKDGTGAPFVLLHGNGEDGRIFNELAEELAADHTVYRIDSRGHGRSGGTGSLGYEAMARDVREFIERVVGPAHQGERPALYGFSDGGIIGLLLATNHPNLLKKLIISGANLHPKGLKNSFLLPAKIAHVFSKNEKLRMMIEEPDIPCEKLEEIKIPVLVLAGERDIIRDEHTKQIAECVPGSKLRILKGEKHGSYVVHSRKLYKVLTEENFI
jgi:pimeloyl-ACP methyl ester carboxylesterase